MKKQIARVSKAEQEKIESDYHHMKPEEFDKLMSRATQRSPNAIRLPKELVGPLKTIAELEGEMEYQSMVMRWVKERLRQEAKLAVKLSKRSRPGRAAALKRPLAK